MAGLTGWHLIIILAIVLLLFGATRLPALARSIGQSVKVFKTEVKPEDKPEGTPGEPGTTGTVNQQAGTVNPSDPADPTPRP